MALPLAARVERDTSSDFPSVPVGRVHGRHGVAIAGPVAVALAFAALAAVPAWGIARAWLGDDGPGIWVRAGVLAFAIVVAIGLVLGALGRLTIPSYLVAEVIVLPVVAVATRTQKSRYTPSVTGGGQWAAVGVWVAIMAFVIGMGLSNSPFTAYDAISYHLFFPARWLQGHRLLILPTPFSDEAQAYQPANGELWFLWLMLPLHGDLLARVGQIPFYLLGAVVSYLVALRCGASRARSLYALTLLMIPPPLISTPVPSNFPLTAPVRFVCAIDFSVVAVDSNRRRYSSMCVLSTGLFLGTKYLAIVYVPLLIVVAASRGVRLRALWGVPGIVALGLPWYVRNWIVAGSPLYPATLTVAGVTLGQGAYTHGAMLQSFMHTSEGRLLGVSLVHAFGAPFFIAFAPFAIVGAIGTAVRRRWWPAVAVRWEVVGVVAL